MPNKLIIQKDQLSDPTVLADCRVGQTKTLTVDVTVTRDDDTTFEADVTDIEYSDASSPDTGGEADSSNPAETEKPMGKVQAAAPVTPTKGY